MRFLFVDNNPAFLLSHRSAIGRALVARGWSVHFASPPGSAVSELERMGFEFHAIPLARADLHPFGELRTVMALLRLYRRLRPDLVHHISIKPIAYGGIAARVAGVPAVVNAVSGLGYVFSGETSRHRSLQLIVSALFRFSFGHPNQRTIVQNPDDLALLRTRTGLDPERAMTIPGSGVDLDAFSPVPEPMAHPPVVLLPARLLRDKGVTEFVEAARRLRTNGTRARFVIAGALDPGNPAALTRAEVESWCAEGVIEWCGPVADMAAEIGASTLVVLPSYREGFPRVLQEAAACGRAIVTTDVPGCRAAVTHGENGLLVAPRDARALAGAIATLLGDPALRRRMGEAGRARAERFWGIGAVVSAHLEVYASLTAGIVRA